jgi:hypothetical protein
MEFIPTQKSINHLNFSGMNFTGEQILRLCKLLCWSETLECLHLSDNKVDEKRSLLNYFGIEVIDD